MQNGGCGSLGKTIEVWRSKEREEGKRKFFHGRKSYQCTICMARISEPKLEQFVG